MTADPKVRREPIEGLRLDLPLRACTIGYENTVKVTIAGQVIDLHGPLEIRPDPNSQPEHRVSISWHPEKE